MPDAEPPAAAGGPSSRADEQQLVGGMANAGKVVRVGDTVRRPAAPHSRAVHALLEHLERAGFDGAPRFVGIDDQGRTVLTYLHGDVAVPPYPGWSAGAELLVSVAELQRRYHDAVRSFVAPAGAVWSSTLAEAEGAPTEPAGAGLVIGHNDLCLENVVCRDGRATAFIDFDFAAPVDPLWDVAIALRHWAPVRDPADLDDARAEVDQAARYRAYCEVYGVADADRSRLVALGLQFLDQAHTKMRERAEAGQAGYVEAWRNGYAAQNRRSHEWLRTNADELGRA